MTRDVWAEIRDAVRPSAAAGTLTEARAHSIATRYRVSMDDVERIYAEEVERIAAIKQQTHRCDECELNYGTRDALNKHRRRIHPTPDITQTPDPAGTTTHAEGESTPAGSGLPDPSPGKPDDPSGGDEEVVPAVEPSPSPAPAGTTGPLPPVVAGRCMSGVLDGDATHTCGLPADHTGDHVCDGDSSAHQDCAYRWERWEDLAESWDAEADAADEPRTAAPRAEVDTALAAIIRLIDSRPDEPVATAASEALRSLRDLQDTIRTVEKWSGQLAELRLLEARVAELRAALPPEYAADAYTQRIAPQAAPGEPGALGGGRVNCPECGREYYVNGLPRHMAIHRKGKAA